MKKLLGILCVLSLVTAEVPSFHPEVLLENVDDGEYWNRNGEFLTPSYVDWDGDGDNDLLIGYMHGSGPATAVITGLMMYYDNIGSNDNPIFKSMGNLPLEVSGA